MQTVLTIAAGVALGILIAVAAIHWGRWLPTTVSTARQIVFVMYPGRKALPLLVIVATAALAALFALYRAEKTMREAEASTFRLWISQNRTRPRIEYLTHRSSAHGRSVLGAAFRRVNIIVGLADDDVQGFGEKDLQHNPLDMIKDTVFEERFLSRFVGSWNASHTGAIMVHLEQGQIADERTLSEAGGTALGALFLAAFLDLPTLPFAAVGLWGAYIMVRGRRAAQ